MKRYALLSVTDKEGLPGFAKGLRRLGFEILSTGGSAQHLREAGVEVTDVADITQLPEMFDGRVKTLHPMIHGGILHERDHSEHRRQAQENRIPSIDVVAVNLYDFAGAMEKGVCTAEMIKYIDIGGPAMLRASAKNHRHCLPVCDPADYSEVLERFGSQMVDEEFRLKMAVKVFRLTAQYDKMIAQGLSEPSGVRDIEAFRQGIPLRYGENPHQAAELVAEEAMPGSKVGIPAAEIHSGKELSYNNYLDLDAGLRLIADFGSLPAVAILKHTNPCGVAAGKGWTFDRLFQAALSSDPTSAFGGIIVTNCDITDKDDLGPLQDLFFECLLAPKISNSALSTLAQQKKNRRLLTLPNQAAWTPDAAQIEIRSIIGGRLLQKFDSLHTLPSGGTPGGDLTSSWRLVTALSPDGGQMEDLKFAWTVVKSLKSNAIVLAKGNLLLGMGSGQTSRIDALTASIEKAQRHGHDLKGAALASDAFFPFADCVEIAARHGIKAIVQPGGSVRDQESVAAADKNGVSMLLTDRRHFKH